MTFQQYSILVSDEVLLNDREQAQDKKFWVSLLDETVQYMDRLQFFYWCEDRSFDSFMAHISSVSNRDRMIQIKFSPELINSRVYGVDIPAFMMETLQSITLTAYYDYANDGKYYNHTSDSKRSIGDDDIEISFSRKGVASEVKLSDLSAKSRVIFQNMIPDIEQIVNNTLTLTY